VEELIRVLLQQAGRAEEANSSCGDVIGRELERSEHSAAIEERPGDVADSFDADSVGKASKMGCRRLIQRPDEVGALIRD
jgi:DNA-directed RNA polymerase subunit N (RpoN/RPB10)